MLDLDKLRQAPHCAITDVFKVGEDWPDSELEQIKSYLEIFASPLKGLECRGCGSSLGGFLGTFTWGLAHGEGRCGQCNLPARGYHRVIDDSGEELLSFQLPLQYHGDGLSYPDEPTP